MYKGKTWFFGAAILSGRGIPLAIAARPQGESGLSPAEPEKDGRPCLGRRPAYEPLYIENIINLFYCTKKTRRSQEKSPLTDRPERAKIKTQFYKTGYGAGAGVPPPWRIGKRVKVPHGPAAVTVLCG